MSIAVLTPALVASAAGIAVVAGMATKLLVSLGSAWLAQSAHSSTKEFLELSINGKDYSVDLKSINNGGSAKIKEALRELERCN
jgi:hypothetical protein